jgi:hypothetical protein
LQSASTAIVLRACRSSRSSRSISNRLSSAWSSRISALGPTREICRHSSAPIEPPAPVTSRLHPHRLAAEHVLHAHLAHLAHELRAVLEQLEDRRHRAHRDAAGAAGADHARAQGAGRRRDGDQHLVGLDVVEHAPELVGGAEHLQPAIDLESLLALVVVDEADGAEAEIGVAQDLAQQQPAAVAGADD